MSSGPDLYLVCKSCGAEVSPYITECPYCGTRIQKRAPKLDRGGVPKAPRRARSRPQLPRLRPGEIPGIRADRRPWAAWVLVLASLLVTVGLKSGLLDYDDFALRHRVSTTRGARSRRSSPTSRPAMRRSPSGTIALFGWLLERRHGWWAPLLVFFVAGAGGAYVAVEVAGEGLDARRQRRRAGPAGGVVDARHPRAPQGLRGRQRPARRARHRRRARAAAARHRRTPAAWPASSAA